MSTIASLVSRDIVRAAPDDTVQRAMQLMYEQDVGAVLVMSGGSLRGIFTERDLMKRVLVPGRDLAGTTLEEVASMDPVTIEENASVRECANLVRQYSFRHVPVMDADGAVAGIISTRDFLSELASGFERVIQRVCETSTAQECEDYYQGVIGSFTD